MATVDDYAIAYALALQVMAQTIKSLSPAAEALLSRVREFVTKSDGGMPDEKKEFTVRDIEQFTKKAKRTVQRGLKECALAGYLEVTQPGGRGKPYKYEYRCEPTTPEVILTNPEDLEQKIKQTEMDKAPLNGQRPMSILTQ